MTKKHNIVFNLTIDDLKELGIIKKRKQRKNKKYVKYLTPNNLKSSSDHMTGYSNVFNNTSNLQQENMRLQNNLLEQKYLNYNDNDNDYYESRFDAIENDTQKLKDIARLAFTQGYSGEFSQPTIEEIDDDEYKYDNTDVPVTYGSDNYKTMDGNTSTPIQATPYITLQNLAMLSKNPLNTSQETTKNPLNTLQETPIKSLKDLTTIPKQEMTSIRKPIANFFNSAFKDKKKVQIKPDSDGFNDIVNTDENLSQKKEIYSKYQFLPSDDGDVKTPIRVIENLDVKPPAPENLDVKPPAPENLDVKPPAPVEEEEQEPYHKKHSVKIRALKLEYSKLNGLDENIHKSRSIKEIQAAIEEQKKINEEKPKVKKSGRKPKK